MVYFRQIFLMIIVVAISLQCCSISADERYRTQIGKLVGEDGGEKRKFAVLEKFRALLDLIKPSTPRRRNLAASPWPAPSPSPYPNGGPVESPAYSPAPQRPIPPHLRRPHPPGQHEIQSRKHEKGGVFVPLVVSTACGIGFVVCVVVVLCLCSRVRKKNGKTLSFKRKQRKSQKVSINPTLDFLYLNSVGVDLERQSSVLVKETENHDELREEEVKTSVETEILLDSDNAGSYSTKEIVSVQEKTEHSVSASEDEESFHSVGDGSQYSNPRLSNASSSSVSASHRDLETKMYGGITGREFVGNMACECVEKHNRRNNKNVKFEHVLRANFDPGAKTKYYITFAARESDSPDAPLVEYQAKVVWSAGITYPIFCRPAPPPPIQG
ncbi:hypothetical protein F2Q69_00032355 [Brassica cretica]|uniref:Cystatin domain-containing protein n=1 Tax=Brassica cretica TaxID=69181 RepID=A0A8S9S0Y9_BRACR|nr:hypothetical protein F2Q69_00032355 [Brassica cretica]